MFVANAAKALDLSSLRFTFKVFNADVQTPNTAYIRVYNLSDGTARQVRNEYSSVILQAGYEKGNFAVIFQGTIKQFKIGKESNVDSYLDIMAADGDIGYNFGVANQTLKAGSSAVDVIKAAAKGMGFALDPNANVGLTGGILPRGKVLFGMWRDYMAQLAATQDSRWSIQNGTLVLVKISGYLPGDVVQINSATGMIGIPEATDNGIEVMTLLNPLVKIGRRVQINNKDVTQTIVREQFFPSYTSGPTLVASVTDDGFYRVLVAEHEGDTRGQSWYTKITCLDLDPSSKPDKSVLPFG